MRPGIWAPLLCGALGPAARASPQDPPDFACPCAASGGSLLAAAATEARGDQGGCDVSKVIIRQEHGGTSGGVSLADVSAVYGGGGALTEEQYQQVHLARVASTPFSCLDDRLDTPSLSTPGGDLGEFILALQTYLSERDPTRSSPPQQEVVDRLLDKYVDSLPEGRPMVHCTDDGAVARLEAELPAENLDLRAPPEEATAQGLLEKLTEAESHGDSHIRLLLKQPEWFELDERLTPMVLRSFYSRLWRDAGASRLELRVLQGESNPEGFLEVSSGAACEASGEAPMLTPKTARRALLISHLDAVSLRREELAAFFAKIANTSPRKVNKERLHQRLNRHGWLALETTGSRIAAGLPFYTLTYA